LLDNKHLEIMTTHLEQINLVFSTTEIDQYFIESATNFGWSEYFMNLDLDEDNELAVAKCHHRCMAIINSIPMSLLPESLINGLR